MARDRANIRIDLWADDDWRKLSLGAQHLYMQLLSHSTLSYAGVADWRPGRLAAVTNGMTAEDIRAHGQELADAAFIYADEETEEVLIRSFTRHDGVIKHPRLHVSMGNDFAGIASNKIKQFVAFEIQKLHSEEPTFALWGHPKVQTILKADALSLKALCPAFAKEKASDSHSVTMRTATATATEAKASITTSEADASDNDSKESREDVEALCKLLADQIEKNGSLRPKITKAWHDSARRMIDLDKRDPVKAANLIRWTQGNAFWRKNVMSMVKFRAQYDQLRLAALEDYDKNGKGISVENEINVEAILGKDYWTVPEAPAHMSIAEGLAWKKEQRAAHDQEREQLARKKVETLAA